MASSLSRLLSDFVRVRVGKTPGDRSDLPISEKSDDLVTQLESADDRLVSQMNDFRTISEDREKQYQSYDEMTNDSVIAAALEIYADDATAYDEQGRIIWVESEDDEIAKAGNRLLDILEIPERAWKHIYQACKYGDYYLKLFRKDELEETDVISQKVRDASRGKVKIVNDVKEDENVIYPLEEYVEDIPDPSRVFDLRKRGKTTGFIEVDKANIDDSSNFMISTGISRTYSLEEVKVYRPDRIIHISIGENLTRTPEEVTIQLGDDIQSVYQVNRGKSILYDVFPIQRELELLEDTLLLNRLTRSSLIRLMEIEVGDMPKKEINNYLRRIKSLVEQHTAMDKTEGHYRSFNSPGPIDNVIYIPVKNGKGSVSVNTLGGDVNVRDIADIDYFNNKRAGALKIPKAYLGEDMDGSGLSNGGSLTKLSARYARTIKRIQTSYIRAITTLLNIYFLDKKLDYVNKFTVRMTSPSTQEDLERNELIQGNIDLISSVMDLMESFSGSTQKKVLNKLISDILKMPEVADIVKEDETPEEDIGIEGDPSGDEFDVDSEGDFGGPESGDEETSDISNDFDSDFDSDAGSEDKFTDDEFSQFEDEL